MQIQLLLAPKYIKKKKKISPFLPISTATNLVQVIIISHWVFHNSLSLPLLSLFQLLSTKHLEQYPSAHIISLLKTLQWFPIVLRRSRLLLSPTRDYISGPVCLPGYISYHSLPQSQAAAYWVLVPQTHPSLSCLRGFVCVVLSTLNALPVNRFSSTCRL